MHMSNRDLSSVLLESPVISQDLKFESSDLKFEGLTARHALPKAECTPQYVAQHCSPKTRIKTEKIIRGNNIC